MISSPTQNIGLGAFYALATALIMSVAAALIKYTAMLVSIEIIVAAQYVICAVFMLPWLLRKGIQGVKTEKLSLHIIRALCGWACFYTYYLAIAHIPLVDAALLRNAAPLCVPFLILLVYRIHIAWIRWIPIAIGFIGIGLILKPDGNALSVWHLIGFGSAITLAGSILSTRMLTRSEPTNRVLFYYFGLSAIASTPLAILNWQPIPVAALLPMLLIGLSIWLTMWLYTQAYLYAKASVISPISYCGVVFTGFWGWYFWDHIPDWLSLAGVILVVSGGMGSLLLGSQAEKREAGLSKAPDKPSV
ncbi:DMT family transporter [Neptunomonas antarctica]|uniref:EamA-like transporter family protein n=1 Tax=Neptunomonas antarctica TaxID=619304 RepID=A0A1N7K4R6_9GAMM|nr:DMT family transporter [Neptunomonas antarctica]SIS56569.1 EamA-like transporter family protein [Neptunomonas antarctica]